MTDTNPLERYSRQMRFPGIGKAGQEKLLASRVTLCGCGALGTVLANVLVRAGVGFVRVIDRDFVEPSNLQRQVLFDESDVTNNLPKAEAAAVKLRQINSAVQVEPIVADINRTNIEDFCAGADLILDGSDNFEIRYLINDVAIKHGKPWVYGGAVGSQGMSMTIIPGETPCLRCVFEAAPAPGETGTCETAGVLAPAVNIVASYQATEALKLLSGNTAAVNRELLIVEEHEPAREGGPARGPEGAVPVLREAQFRVAGRRARHANDLAVRAQRGAGEPAHEGQTGLRVPSRRAEAKW
jgi:molybdopterin-synthase adenylyltransferase